jgi:hypothetical protein
MTADDLVEAKLGVMGVPFQRKRPDGSPMFTRAFLGLAQVAMDGNKIVSNWYPGAVYPAQGAIPPGAHQIAITASPVGFSVTAPA